MFKYKHRVHKTKSEFRLLIVFKYEHGAKHRVSLAFWMSIYEHRVKHREKHRVFNYELRSNHKVSFGFLLCSKFKYEHRVKYRVNFNFLLCSRTLLQTIFTMCFAVLLCSYILTLARLETTLQKNYHGCELIQKFLNFPHFMTGKRSGEIV